MNPLVPLLLDLTAELLAYPGVAAGALRTLRIALAATLLRDNPALPPIVCVTSAMDRAIHRTFFAGLWCISPCGSTS